MKKLKVLSAAVVGALLLLAAGPLRPAFAASDAYTVIDSTTVTISTSMLTGATKILSATNNPADVFLFFVSTGNALDTVAIGSDANVSTKAAGGYARFPVGQLIQFLDYKGPLWAIVVGTAPLNGSVLRKR